jgi:hypothetical protein
MINNTKNNKVPSKKVTSKEAPSRKATTKASSRKKAEPGSAMQAFNDLQDAWVENVMEGASWIMQIQAKGGVDPSEDAGMMEELADLFNVTAMQAESLVGCHQAFIKGLRTRPDASSITHVIDSHKDEIALKRTSARNSRLCEKKLRRMLAKG